MINSWRASAWSRGMIIPRPHAFLANSLMFCGGVLCASLEGYGIQPEMSQSTMPSWLFVALWFLVQEVLVQQAKYMWNDIQDHKRDQKIPANRTRPLARQPLSKTTAIIMVGRWTLGITLAVILSPVLLTVVLTITILQIIYELWAKPLAAQHPKLPLFIVAAGTVLKFCGGCLAMGWPEGQHRLWLYGLALFATGIVYVSSFWRVESAYFQEKRLPFPRGQSAYYARKGLSWLKAGTVVTTLVCIILIFDGYNHFLTQSEIYVGWVFVLIIAIGICCCQLCFWLLSTSTTIQFGKLVLIIMICIGYVWLQIQNLLPISKQTFSAALLLVVLLIDHRLNYTMDYQQQNLMYLSKNWPNLIHTTRLRQQNPNDAIQWHYLLQLTLALNTPRYQDLRKRCPRD